MSQNKTKWLAGGLSVFGLVFMGGVATLILRVADAPVEPVAAVKVQTTQPAVVFSAQQVTAMVRKQFPQERVVAAPELVDYNGTVAYEFALKQGKVYVDAGTGQWLNVQSNAVVEARNDKAYPSKRERGHRENHHEEEREDDDG